MSRTQSHADRAALTASADALRRFATEIFARTGMPEADAAVVADVLVWANLQGVDTHPVLEAPMHSLVRPIPRRQVLPRSARAQNP